MRYFKHAVAAALWLLLAAPSNAHVSAAIHHTTNQCKQCYKDDDQRMFLIAVIDSHDETIGERCKADLDGITDEFEYVAQEIGAEWITPKIIEGDSFSKAAVNDAIDNWLKNQQPSEDDIVVFYYSGHGFRYPNDASSYARMWLKTAQDKDPATTNLSIEEDIYNRIIKMGAGVNIVISDCCNSTYDAANANFDNVMVPTHNRNHSGKDKTNNISNNGHALFMPGQPLSILAAAAGKGELAGGKADDGGFFTAYFLDALDDYIDDDSRQATWENIFKYADENAGYWAKSAACPEARHNEAGRCVQTAVIKIDDNN